jgi:hypothetical protein
MGLGVARESDPKERDGLIWNFLPFSSSSLRMPSVLRQRRAFPTLKHISQTASLAPRLFLRRNSTYKLPEPSWVVFPAYAKERWIGRQLLDVLAYEFRARPREYHASPTYFVLIVRQLTRLLSGICNPVRSSSNQQYSCEG